MRLKRILGLLGNDALRCYDRDAGNMDKILRIERQQMCDSVSQHGRCNPRIMGTFPHNMLSRYQLLPDGKNLSSIVEQRELV